MMKQTKFLIQGTIVSILFIAGNIFIAEAKSPFPINTYTTIYDQYDKLMDEQTLSDVIVNRIYQDLNETAPSSQKKYTKEDIQLIAKGNFTPIQKIVSDHAAAIQEQQRVAEIKSFEQDLASYEFELQVMTGNVGIYSNGSLADSSYDLIVDLTELERIWFNNRVKTPVAAWGMSNYKSKSAPPPPPPHPQSNGNTNSQTNGNTNSNKNENTNSLNANDNTNNNQSTNTNDNGNNGGTNRNTNSPGQQNTNRNGLTTTSCPDSTTLNNNDLYNDVSNEVADTLQNGQTPNNPLQFPDDTLSHIAPLSIDENGYYHVEDPIDNANNNGNGNGNGNTNANKERNPEIVTDEEGGDRWPCNEFFCIRISFVKGYPSLSSANKDTSIRSHIVAMQESLNKLRSQDKTTNKQTKTTFSISKTFDSLGSLVNLTVVTGSIPVWSPKPHVYASQDPQKMRDTDKTNTAIPGQSFAISQGKQPDNRCSSLQNIMIPSGNTESGNNDQATCAQILADDLKKVNLFPMTETLIQSNISDMQVLVNELISLQNSIKSISNQFGLMAPYIKNLKAKSK